MRYNCNKTALETEVHMKQKSDDKPTAANILEHLKEGLREGIFDSSDNEAECLYGPPEMLYPPQNEIEGVYGPPSIFDPSQNEPIDVYGPPDDDLNHDEDDEQYDPRVNIAPPVYGPPA